MSIKTHLLTPAGSSPDPSDSHGESDFEGSVVTQPPRRKEVHWRLSKKKEYLSDDDSELSSLTSDDDDDDDNDDGDSAETQETDHIVDPWLTRVVGATLDQGLITKPQMQMIVPQQPMHGDHFANMNLGVPPLSDPSYQHHHHHHYYHPDYHHQQQLQLQMQLQHQQQVQQVQQVQHQHQQQVLQQQQQQVLQQQYQQHHPPLDNWNAGYLPGPSSSVGYGPGLELSPYHPHSAPAHEEANDNRSLISNRRDDGAPCSCCRRADEGKPKKKVKIRESDSSSEDDNDSGTDGKPFTPSRTHGSRNKPKPILKRRNNVHFVSITATGAIPMLVSDNIVVGVQIPLPEAQAALEKIREVRWTVLSVTSKLVKQKSLHLGIGDELISLHCRAILSPNNAASPDAPLEGGSSSTIPIREGLREQIKTVLKGAPSDALTNPNATTLKALSQIAIKCALETRNQLLPFGESEWPKKIQETTRQIETIIYITKVFVSGLPFLNLGKQLSQLQLPFFFQKHDHDVRESFKWLQITRMISTLSEATLQTTAGLVSIGGYFKQDDWLASVLETMPKKVEERNKITAYLDEYWSQLRTHCDGLLEYVALGEGALEELIYNLQQREAKCKETTAKGTGEDEPNEVKTTEFDQRQEVSVEARESKTLQSKPQPELPSPARQVMEPRSEPSQVSSPTKLQAHGPAKNHVGETVKQRTGTDQPQREGNVSRESPVRGREARNADLERPQERVHRDSEESRRGDQNEIRLESKNPDNSPPQEIRDNRKEEKREVRGGTYRETGKGGGDHKERSHRENHEDQYRREQAEKHQQYGEYKHRGSRDDGAVRSSKQPDSPREKPEGARSDIRNKDHVRDEQRRTRDPSDKKPENRERHDRDRQGAGRGEAEKERKKHPEDGGPSGKPREHYETKERSSRRR